MTFDGSRDLAGDADLIAGGLLVEFKATRGNSPRKDGSRYVSLARTDLYQLVLRVERPAYWETVRSLERR